MSLEHLHVGDTSTVTGRRTVIMQNQGLTVYDIHLIRYSFSGVNFLQTNDVLTMALSLRDEDQVEDATAVGFETMQTTQGIFAVYTLNIDFFTEGGASLKGGQNIPFPLKPYTVPYAAWIVNPALADVGIYGVEVWFERRRISSREKSYMVSEAGGRARTS